jgi:hypothetical protein
MERINQIWTQLELNSSTAAGLFKLRFSETSKCDIYLGVKLPEIHRLLILKVPFNIGKEFNFKYEFRGLKFEKIYADTFVVYSYSSSLIASYKHENLHTLNTRKNNSPQYVNPDNDTHNDTNKGLRINSNKTAVNTFDDTTIKELGCFMSSEELDGYWRGDHVGVQFKEVSSIISAGGLLLFMKSFDHIKFLVNTLLARMRYIHSIPIANEIIQIS